ncbi:hypothetical protein D3C87_1894060 [compost metagenome]
MNLAYFQVFEIIQAFVIHRPVEVPADRLADIDMVCFLPQPAKHILDHLLGHNIVLQNSAGVSVQSFEMLFENFLELRFPVPAQNRYVVIREGCIHCIDWFM